MGVDAKLYLPASCQLRTFGDVAAALLGVPMTKNYFSGSSGGWAAGPKDHSSIEYRVDALTAGCATILFSDVSEAVVGAKRHSMFYHFEFGGPGRPFGAGSRGVIARSRAFNLALFCRLAAFFGGVVDYADCDDQDSDFVATPRTDEENAVEDDATWYALQERILAVRSITTAEIEAEEEFAAYKRED